MIEDAGGPVARDVDVRPAVVVVVEDGDAGACGFDDVFFSILAAENDWRCEPSFGGDIRKMRDWFCIRFRRAIGKGNPGKSPIKKQPTPRPQPKKTTK